MKKSLLISGLALSLIVTPLANTESVMAKEPANKIVQTKQKEITLTNRQVVKVSSEWAKIASYIQNGGKYNAGEYKTFTHKNKTYRYLSKDIDTRREILALLQKRLTKNFSQEWLKTSGIIEYKGKLAQLEADGGSLLQWDKAVATFIKTDKKTRSYRLVIPVGDTGEKEARIVEVQFENGRWKLNKLPYLDLDVPFNINPAFIFFKYLLVDNTTSQEQLLNVDFDVEKFKKGIQKVEVKDLKELGRNSAQVEFAVSFSVKLSKDYKGTLKNGMNKMYFLVQPTGDMEFKIVSIGSVPHLKIK
jgi:hypothetical protein